MVSVSVNDNNSGAGKLADEYPCSSTSVGLRPLRCVRCVRCVDGNSA